MKQRWTLSDRRDQSLSVTVVFAADESGASIENLMTAPAANSVQSELAASDPTDVPPPNDGFRQRPERVEIYSRIAGAFNGWTSKTRLPLENGQIWEQRKGWRWRITLESPEVRIYKNFTGAYEMEIVSEGRSIEVRRIR